MKKILFALFLLSQLSIILVCCKKKKDTFKYYVKETVTLSKPEKKKVYDPEIIRIENEVISALIKSEFKPKRDYNIPLPDGSIKKVKIETDIVLVKETENSSTAQFSLKYSKFKSLDTLAYYDYEDKKRDTLIIDLISGSNLKITYYSEPELYSIFLPSRNKGWDWDKYDELYGFTPIVRVSRVGLNKSRNKAFVFFSCVRAPRGGYADFVLLEKINGKWIVKETSMAWVS